MSCRLGGQSTTICAAGGQKAFGSVSTMRSSWPYANDGAARHRPRRRSSTAPWQSLETLGAGTTAYNLKSDLNLVGDPVHETARVVAVSEDAGDNG